MTNFGGRVIDEHSGAAGKLVSTAVIVGIVVILLFMSVTMVGPGQVGVTTLFGRVTDEVLYSGIHLVNPLKRVHELTVRTQSLKESASVPSSEGLVINLDSRCASISVRM